jgi:hypothetical protein
VSVTSLSIQATRTKTGYQYTVTVNIHESAGVAVTVSSVDLTFSANGTTVGTTHFDSPYSTKVPASGSASSKSLVTTDDVQGHAFATRVDTLVTFTDDNQHGGTATETDTVPALPDPPAITSFSATPSNITNGQATNLQWVVASVSSVQIDNGIGTVAASGQRLVNPSSTTTYTLTANNDGGSATGAVTVTVSAQPVPNPPIITSFSVSRSNITIGDSVTLQWCVTNATSVSINNGVGSVVACGQATVVPPGNTNYTLTASNAGGSTNQSVGVATTIPSGICAANTAPAGATAMCKDGTYSQSQNRSGTCSSHGGVSCWICPGALCSGLPVPLADTTRACPTAYASKH